MHKQVIEVANCKCHTWPLVEEGAINVVRCGSAQRIIAIQGVSLMRILNLPHLIGQSGEILNIPSGSVVRSLGRLGESLMSCAPSRFSLEILPPSLVHSLLCRQEHSQISSSLSCSRRFTDPHSLAPQYCVNIYIIEVARWLQIWGYIWPLMSNCIRRASALLFNIFSPRSPMCYRANTWIWLWKTVRANDYFLVARGRGEWAGVMRSAPRHWGKSSTWVGVATPHGPLSAPIRRQIDEWHRIDGSPDMSQLNVQWRKALRYCPESWGSH